MVEGRHSEMCGGLRKRDGPMTKRKRNVNRDIVKTESLQIPAPEPVFAV
jgi:hypothetical protein